jgi:hypothetical protein
MKRRWTAKEIKYLVQHNETHATWQLAKDLNRTKTAVLLMCQKLKLPRSLNFPRDPEILARQPKREYRPSPRQLKPGLHKYGSVKNPRRNYWWIKVEGNPKLMQYHRYVWLQAGREIPPGYKLRFIDGNIDNVTLENLELVTSPAVAPEVKAAIRQARWGNREKANKAYVSEYNKRYKERKKIEAKTAKLLGKNPKELSFVDRVLMGIV